MNLIEVSQWVSEWVIELKFSRVLQIAQVILGLSPPLVSVREIHLSRGQA